MKTYGITRFKQIDINTTQVEGVYATHKITKITYENSQYRIVKEEIESDYHNDKIYNSLRVNFEIYKLCNQLNMPSIYVMKKYDSDDNEYFILDVTTTSFGGYTLDFIEEYSYKLQFAVASAREIEKMLNDKEL